MLAILQHFAIAEGRLEITLKCWSLHPTSGGLATIVANMHIDTQHRC